MLKNFYNRTDAFGTGTTITDLRYVIFTYLIIKLFLV